MIRVCLRQHLKLVYRPNTYRSKIVRIGVRSLSQSRILLINPLLPFDVVDELMNEELEEKNEELKKDKKKLKKKLKNKSKPDGKYKTENDSVPIDKAVSQQVKGLEVEKMDVKEKPHSDDSSTTAGTTAGASNTATATPESDSTPSGDGSAKAVAGGSGGGDDGHKRPPREEEDDEYEEEEPEPTRFQKNMKKFGSFLFKCLETIGITFSSVAILGVAGLLYHKFYNIHVLDKMDLAFDFGDPAYQLSVHKRTSKHLDDDGEDSNAHDLSEYWVERPQQKLLDDIIAGKIVGRYFLVVGEKGTGKTSLLLESMKKVNGFNVAILDAHSDPEIFRIRLGRALNFTFNEDYIGSLFSIRGPRDTTALLDIERAFNKLEELAIRRVPKHDNRPLVLIINNAHLIRENEEGDKLLELLQQKAEALSGSGLMTIIFNSDDYWVYEKLKKLGTRLELINVRDFNRFETVKALRFIREKHFPSHKFKDLSLTDDDCHKIYDLIGGRPQHISQVARHKNMFNACHEIIDREKTWFLNQSALLGFDMDDDVNEHGKFSTSSMLLMREFVEMDRKRLNTLIQQESPDEKDRFKNHELPDVPLWRARQIMTRPDYIQRCDNLNLFTIDSESRVKADSVPMMRAFHEIASQPKFDEFLEDSLERVADIESLERTREIVIKDLSLGSRYILNKSDDKNRFEFSVDKSRRQKIKDGEIEDDEDIDDYLLEDIHQKESKKWWKKRMSRFNAKTPSKGDEYDIDINRADHQESRK